MPARGSGYSHVDEYLGPRRAPWNRPETRSRTTRDNEFRHTHFDDVAVLAVLEDRNFVDSQLLSWLVGQAHLLRIASLFINDLKTNWRQYIVLDS